MSPTISWSAMMIVWRSRPRKRSRTALKSGPWNWMVGVGSPAAVFAATSVLSLASGLLLLGLAYEAAPRAAPAALRRIVRETVEGYRAFVRYPDAGVLFRGGRTMRRLWWWGLQER